ncbi:hypothetical protein [Pseudomonas aeruginosa]|uniref:hypothetical protein n=1 Tax=Pseudomonas aeruginosa TaxID=287 RepID=UPI0034E08B5C
MAGLLNPSRVVFALGASDPELVSIQYMLRKAGYSCALAYRRGKRCVSSNAYQADALSRRVEAARQVVWVECRTPDYNSDRDLIVDHHNEGDPGFAAPPASYWEGSSIGQVASLIGGKHSDFKLVAASDHCLSAAMRGECPGVDPKELMAWRITARSAMAKIQPWVLRRRIERASERVLELPRLNLGGVLIADGSFDSTPELRDAAALVQIPILTTRKTSSGQIKIGLYGAEPDVVAVWLSSMRAADVVDHAYGNPHREYAGAVLNLETSERLIRANLQHVCF